MRGRCGWSSTLSFGGGEGPQGQALRRSTFLMNSYSLGTSRSLTKAAAIMRGYGVRMVRSGRDITPARSSCTGRTAETFFANAGAGAGFRHQRQGRRGLFLGAAGQSRGWRKREIADEIRACAVEWEPAGACSLRDGHEVNRTTRRESRLQIVLNEGGDPFLLRRTSYGKCSSPANTRPTRSSRGGNLWPAGCSGNCGRS